PRGGVVTAIVRSAGERVELRIEDNGPGIPAAEREHVFERFYRMQHDRSDGCGLGLAIVREIAEASGAHVSLRDPVSGEGLIAVVEFSLAANQRAAEANSVV